ncbi:uridine kinase [Prochlorococcus marinus XMU1403]|uniref:uridine kinase family protein n=1 Tax=Prochlorococcus marinus TaxID=1219 RepID=UPI000D9C30A8|nr:AAA family ATPase [Prochlorococcus marinus]MBW3049425.1 uridine kinase [Prochlorococcus marinus str. MU1403]PYE02377.1 uridine kinase [Prochlorococcus marinus XMU1403]
MKTIIITGPSGSGKTYLSKKISKLFNNTIVIKTDSYYKDNIFIRFLSILQYDIYDRPMSFKKNEIKKTLRSLYNKCRLISFYKYDFKRKHSSKSEGSINYEGENQLLIVEGIFAHRLDLNYNETINIICKEEKDICFKRRLKRDQLERGRDSREVHKKFNKSWYLYYENVQKYLNNFEVLSINPLDMISYDQLVLYLQKKTN